MAILALDIATTTGWALLDPRTPDRPYLGSVRFPSDPGEIGRAAENMRQFLADRHQMHGGLEHIVFEAQHVAGKMDMKVLNRLIGLATMVEWFAYRIDAKCYTVPIGSWRKHAFGTGHMKRDEAKRRAMEECRALSFDPTNDNEAEAFFVLDYYIALRNKHGAGIAQPWRDNAFFDRSGAQR
jgi:hypothetical protein